VVAEAQKRVAVAHRSTLDGMKNRPSQATRRARLAPLDHLRAGGRPQADAEKSEAPTQTQPTQAQDRPLEGAEPADPMTPGAGDAEATRGKATRSPASVATRRHLEGSEQGPA
jgi:hypothetical protein